MEQHKQIQMYVGFDEGGCQDVATIKLEGFSLVDNNQLEVLKSERDTAWQELREIREAIGANPEESTADEVRRVIAQKKQLIKMVDKARDDYIEDHFDGENDCVTPFDWYGPRYEVSNSKELIPVTDEKQTPSEIGVRLYLKSAFNKEAGLLELTVESKINSVTQQLSRDLINMKDDVVRKALIELGWVPPELTEKLYLVSGYSGDPESTQTDLVEAGNAQIAQDIFVRKHFPDAMNWDIHFAGTLTNLLADVLK